MNPLTFSDVRNHFNRFYGNLNFSQLPEASMIHPSIPMSFVMSAGLVQIESALASGALQTGDKYTLIQNCFRHFDKSRVGTEPHHLSLFEMSGAFEFGPFDQKEIIQKLWDFITKKIKLDPKKIWATYYRGGKVGNELFSPDLASFHAWKEAGVLKKQIVGLSEKDNFWIQGGNFNQINEGKRKCGANSELFYDKGQELQCSKECQPGCRCGRFVEFANVLFVQYELSNKDHSLAKLNLPFAETVIGNERLAMITQGKNRIFDVQAYQKVRNIFYEKSAKSFSLRENSYTDVNIIVDHLRALYALTGSGAPPPGRGGRAHIIKGLIRGVLSRFIVLNVSFHELADSILNTMIKSFYYDDLRESRSEPICDKLWIYFKLDIDRFTKTLLNGQKYILKILSEDEVSELSTQRKIFIEKQLGIPQIVIDKIVKEKAAIF